VAAGGVAGAMAYQWQLKAHPAERRSVVINVASVAWRNPGVSAGEMAK